MTSGADGEAPRDWDADPDMRALRDVAAQLARTRAAYDVAERDLLRERDQRVARLHRRGATFTEMAPRAQVSDTLLSRRNKRLGGVQDA